MTLSGLQIVAGDPTALGAIPCADGVSFALFSAHAERVELCLFDEAGTEHRLTLPERDGDIWHGFVPGIGPGQAYGYRVYGPWAPEQGHRFNPAKLLIDPYARALDRRIVAHPDMRGDDGADGPCPVDSAPHVPRSLVTERPTPPGPRAPARSWAETVIVEGHAKGLTRLHPTAPHAGTYQALAHPPVLDHLKGIGATALELLPVQAFIDDAFLLKRGLVNYWGYQPIAFFAPEPRSMGPAGAAGLRATIDALHAAGLEVLIDVVFNHTGESDAVGPTLCFRGIDNASYYRLDDAGGYINDTGTGNTLDTSHPMVARLVLDSLRHWVTDWGVDGFRFDLCATLGRGPEGPFDPDGALFTAMRADPVLRQVRLIAEPWDIGPGGYQLGAFPAPFAEWNDRFRDCVRQFWKGDPGVVGELAGRLVGSAEIYDRAGRRPTASVNLVTAHDGFTLADLTRFNTRHNLANGEAGRDGHGANHSDNMGAEGDSADPAILAARAQRARNLMATLMLAQGTPMLLAGDALGHSQGGNNNAYCQDNEISWVDWSGAEEAPDQFARRLARLRAETPVLRQDRFLHGALRPDGRPDIAWWRPDGAPKQSGDWSNPEPDLLIVELRGCADAPAPIDGAALMVLNRGAAVEVALPPALDGMRWARVLDSAAPDVSPRPAGRADHIAAHSVTVFREEPA